MGWLLGEDLPARPQAKAPDVLYAEYQQLRDRVGTLELLQRGVMQPCTMPWPADLGDMLLGAPEWDGTPATFVGAISGPPATRRRVDTVDGGGTLPPLDLTQVAHALRMPILCLGRRGAAGGGPAGGNLCVLDSISQLLSGSPSAADDAAARTRACALAGEIRNLAGISGDGNLPTGETWRLLVGRAFAPHQARPVLLELPLGGTPPRVQVDHLQFHGTPGRWNGTLLCVLSDGSHTVPVWWPHHAGPGGRQVGGIPVAPCVVAPAGTGPRRVTAMDDLSEAVITALWIGVSIDSHEHRRSVVPGALPSDEEAMMIARRLAAPARGSDGSPECSVIIVQAPFGRDGPAATGLEVARFRVLVARPAHCQVVVCGSNGAACLRATDQEQLGRLQSWVVGGNEALLSAVVTGRQGQ